MRHLLLLLALTGCIKTPGDGSVLKEEIPRGNADERHALGTGHVTKLGTFGTNPCVEGTLQWVPRPNAELLSGFSERMDKSENGLKMVGEATGNLGILKVTGQVEIETKLAESDLKTSAYTTFTYKAGSLLLLDPKLTTRAKDLAAATGPDARANKLEECGDEYVYQEELGGRLNIGLEYSFATTELKNKFNAKIGVSDPFGAINFEIALPEADVEWGKLRAEVKLIFFQEGGDKTSQDYLDMVGLASQGCIMRGEEVTGDDGKRKGVIKGMQQCLEIYAKLVDYARTKFRQQIKTAGVANEQLESRLAVLRYFSKRYASSSFIDFQEELNVPEATDVIAGKMVTVARKADRLRRLHASFANLLANRADVEPNPYAAGDHVAAETVRNNITAVQGPLGLLVQGLDNAVSGCRADLAAALLGKPGAKSLTTAGADCNAAVTQADTRVTQFIATVGDAKLRASLQKEEVQ